MNISNVCNLIKKNNSVYIITFVCISCVLFFVFALQLIQNPLGPQRLIFNSGLDSFFSDFFVILTRVADRDPYNKGLNYFPLSYVILYPFSQLDNFGAMTVEEAWNSKMGLISVFLFTGFSVYLLFMSLGLIRKKSHAPFCVLVSLVLSFTFLNAIERGNLIILAAAFLGFFICYYDSENKYERMFAAVSLAMASTLKVYPVLFGFLYFEKKQYREIFLSAAVTLLLIFLPFLFFRNGFNDIPKLFHDVGEFVEKYNFTFIDLRFGLVNLVYVVLVQLNFSKPLITTLCNTAQVITYLLSFASIVLSVFIRNRWLKISLLTITLIFLPVYSYWYCGLYLFPMIVLFFSSLEERSKLFNIFVFIVFMIFLNPYQITLGYDFRISFNFLFGNIALLSLWLTLLIYSGRQIISLFKSRMAINA